MDWLEQMLMTSAPADDGGADDKDDDADKKDDDANDDGKDDDAEAVAKEALRLAKEKYSARDKKRSKKIDEVTGRVTSLEDKVSEALEKLNQIAENVSTGKKSGQSKKDDSDVDSDSDYKKLLKVVTEKFTSLETQLRETKEAQNKDRELSSRREVLQDMGASRKFVQMVEKGFITIPDRLWDDDFDGLTTFVDDLNGFGSTKNVVADTTADTKNSKPVKKSVPHKNGDADTSSVHMDKKSKGGIDEAVAAAEKGIDDVFKDLKKDKKSINKDDLSTLFDLAEKVDKTLSDERR